MTFTRSEEFANKLRDADSLKPFPIIGTKMVETVENPDKGLADAAELLTTDPALASRVLSMANSPLYGFGGKVRDVEHACVVLGTQSIKTLVLTVVASELFDGSPELQATRKELWKHSVGVAAIARELGTAVSPNVADEAFLAAVLHDVGKLVFIDFAGKEYIDMAKNASTLERINLERDSFGVTHEEIGRKCGKKWRLPRSAIQVMGAHHLNESALDNNVSQLVMASNLLSKVWELGSENDSVMTVEEIVDRCQLTIDPSILDEELFPKAKDNFQAFMDSVS